MFLFMAFLFVLGYVFIALEHVVHINKSATALVLAALLWVCVAFGIPSEMFVFPSYEQYLLANPDASFISWITSFPLLHHFGETSEILFFLIGAMTIVELIDSHKGFSIITDKIVTTKKTSLLWLLSFITFFMSAVLDNMTTTIVMIALARKLIADRADRWLYAGIIVLVANAGGAWSPIGDVTTIMLWVANKVSSMHIIKATFFASLVSVLVPLIILSFRMKGHLGKPDEGVAGADGPDIPHSQRLLLLIVGVSALLFVPVFKTVTHLPPYLGMLGGLGVLWILTDILHRKNETMQSTNSVVAVLKRVDIASVIFFLGILMSVAALQTYGHLNSLSVSLDSIALPEPEKYYFISVIIGLFSAIVDNVPLVAASMGMYDFPMNHYFWEFIAFTAGTGGSILIIGSAAGVAAMGMEKIDFIWYLKKISWLALIGYFAGCVVFILEKMLFA